MISKRDCTKETAQKKIKNHLKLCLPHKAPLYDMVVGLEKIFPPLYPKNTQDLTYNDRALIPISDLAHVY